MNTRTSTTTRTISTAFALLAGAAAPALASPVGTTFADLAHCDPLSGPSVADELGVAPLFPVPCTIDAGAFPTTISACPSDVPGLPNVLLRITNLTGRTFSDLWYVGEQGTGFTNFDGTVNGMEAFRIDDVGVNRPLISESIPNGLFEPGETWAFVIDDWFNGAGFSAADLTSIGVPSGGGLSSGSIIAVELPGPGAASLLAASGLLIIRRRR